MSEEHRHLSLHVEGACVPPVHSVRFAATSVPALIKSKSENFVLKMFYWLQRETGGGRHFENVARPSVRNPVVTNRVIVFSRARGPTKLRNMH